MYNIITYINLNCHTEDISLNGLAEKFGVCKYKLSRFLNDYFQCPLDIYVQNLRLKRAVALMSEKPDFNLKSICFESGFRSEPQFNRVFKKNFGCTPKEYRGKYKILTKKDLLPEFSELIKKFTGQLESGHVGFGVSFNQWLEHNNHYKLVGLHKYVKLNQ